ncbi:hypothetical protein DPMN_036262 [Dreissena polymorpha]|uniref:Uncharacterized protein n=1 Tax=Dreissena polymorpha TaxID=45954 RepID=A0A9D4M8U6_DREPO|nr:hypothetical protein DPMN_036262 [Dreissena polymorpha]
MLLHCCYQLVQFWILFFIWNLACDKAINEVTNYIIFIIERWRVFNPKNNVGMRRAPLLELNAI